MEINFYSPVNPKLKGHIEAFYTLERAQADKPISYLGFPNTRVYVLLCEKVSLCFDSENIKISHDPTAMPQSILILDYEKPGAITYEGQASEITIYFKPLGLSAFLDHDFSFYKTGVATPFVPFSDYNEMLTTLFALPDPAARILFLENYWLAKHKGFRHAFLQNMLTDMQQTGKQPWRISGIAAKYGVSRTTFHKQFNRHLGISPSQFLKIIRFREALRLFAANNPAHKLTDIAYLTEYFDQSHMVKDFKSLTGYAPKAFFERLSSLENGQITWLFL